MALFAPKALFSPKLWMGILISLGLYTVVGRVSMNPEWISHPPSIAKEEVPSIEKNSYSMGSDKSPKDADKSHDKVDRSDYARIHEESRKKKRQDKKHSSSIRYAGPAPSTPDVSTSSGSSIIRYADSSVSGESTTNPDFKGEKHGDFLPGSEVLRKGFLTPAKRAWLKIKKEQIAIKKEIKKELDEAKETDIGMIKVIDDETLEIEKLLLQEQYALQVQNALTKMRAKELGIELVDIDLEEDLQKKPSPCSVPSTIQTSPSSSIPDSPSSRVPSIIPAYPSSVPSIPASPSSVPGASSSIHVQRKEESMQRKEDGFVEHGNRKPLIAPLIIMKGEKRKHSGNDVGTNVGAVESSEKDSDEVIITNEKLVNPEKYSKYLKKERLEISMKHEEYEGKVALKPPFQAEACQVDNNSDAFGQHRNSPQRSLSDAASEKCKDVENNTPKGHPRGAREIEMADQKKAANNMRIECASSDKDDKSEKVKSNRDGNEEGSECENGSQCSASDASDLSEFSEEVEEYVEESDEDSEESNENSENSDEDSEESDGCSVEEEEGQSYVGIDDKSNHGEQDADFDAVSHASNNEAPNDEASNNDPASSSRTFMARITTTASAKVPVVDHSLRSSAQEAPRDRITYPAAVSPRTAETSALKFHSEAVYGMTSRTDCESAGNDCHHDIIAEEDCQNDSTTQEGGSLFTDGLGAEMFTTDDLPDNLAASTSNHDYDNRWAANSSVVLYGHGTMRLHDSNTTSTSSFLAAPPGVVDTKAAWKSRYRSCRLLPPENYSSPEDAKVMWKRYLARLFGLDQLNDNRLDNLEDVGDDGNVTIGHEKGAIEDTDDVEKCIKDIDGSDISELGRSGIEVPDYYLKFQGNILEGDIALPEGDVSIAPIDGGTQAGRIDDKNNSTVPFDAGVLPNWYTKHQGTFAEGDIAAAALIEGSCPVNAKEKKEGGKSVINGDTVVHDKEESSTSASLFSSGKIVRQCIGGNAPQTGTKDKEKSKNTGENKSTNSQDYPVNKKDGNTGSDSDFDMNEFQFPHMIPDYHTKFQGNFDQGDIVYDMGEVDPEAHSVSSLEKIPDDDEGSSILHPAKPPNPLQEAIDKILDRLTDLILLEERITYRQIQVLKTILKVSGIPKINKNKLQKPGNWQILPFEKVRALKSTKGKIQMLNRFLARVSSLQKAWRREHSIGLGDSEEAMSSDEADSVDATPILATGGIHGAGYNEEVDKEEHKIDVVDGDHNSDDRVFASEDGKKKNGPAKAKTEQKKIGAQAAAKPIVKSASAKQTAAAAGRSAAARKPESIIIDKSKAKTKLVDPKIVNRAETVNKTVNQAPKTVKKTVTKQKSLPKHEHKQKSLQGGRSAKGKVEGHKMRRSHKPHEHKQSEKKRRNADERLKKQCAHKHGHDHKKVKKGGGRRNGADKRCCK